MSKPEWVEIRMTKQQAIRAEAALGALWDCHDNYADCHVSNHPQWQREALMRLFRGVENAAKGDSTE